MEKEYKDKCDDYLAKADKATLKTKCEDNHVSKLSSCKKYREEEITELIGSDRENAILKCADKEGNHYAETDACKKLREEAKKLKSDEIANLINSDRQKAILKCDDDKDEYYFLDVCYDLRKNEDEVLEAYASNEGPDWKVKTCRLNEYSLSPSQKSEAYRAAIATGGRRVFAKQIAPQGAVPPSKKSSKNQNGVSTLFSFTSF